MVARFRSVIRLPVSCRERVHSVMGTVVQCCETEVDRLNLKCTPPPPQHKVLGFGGWWIQTHMYYAHTHMRTMHTIYEYICTIHTTTHTHCTTTHMCCAHQAHHNSHEPWPQNKMAVSQPMKLDHCPPEHSLEQACRNHKKSLNLLAKWTASPKAPTTPAAAIHPRHIPQTLLHRNNGPDWLITRAHK